MNFVKGDRVVHKVYGLGTFVRYIKYTKDLAIVKLDKPRPGFFVPTTVFVEDLKKVESDLHGIALKAGYETGGIIINDE